MSIAKKIILNTGIIYIKLLIKLIVGLFTTRIILNTLGETDYGIYALVGGIIGMLGVLEVSMSIASMRFIANALGTKNLETIKKTFNSSLIIHFILAFVIVIVLEVGGWLMFDYLLNIPINKLFEAKIVFHFMVITSFVSIISVPFSAVITSHENFLALSIIEIIGALVNLLIAIILVFVHFDRLIIYGFLILLNQILLRIIMQLYCKYKYIECRIKFKDYIDKIIVLKMLSFAGWSAMGVFSGIFTIQMRAVLLNIFFGVKLNTANGITSMLTGQLDQISEGMTNSVQPQIMKSEGGGDRNKLILLTEITSKYSVLLFTIFAIPVIIELPYLLKLWLKYVPEYAVIFSRLLIFTMILEKFSFPITTALQSVGNIKSLTNISMFLSLLGALVAYLLYKMGFQPESIFYVFICVSILKLIVRMNLGKRYVGLNINSYFKKVFFPTVPPLLIASVFSMIPFLVIEESLIRVLFTIVLSFVISITLIRYLSLNETELLSINRFIYEVKQRIKKALK